MYNLLVSGSGWADGRDTFPESRVLEYTEKKLINKFSIGTELDLEALKTLPSLFLQESFRDGNQSVRVGTILRLDVTGQELALEYVYDPSIPPLTNSFLESISTELGIQDFEFSRTHWAVKDIDLFRVLLRNLQPRRQKPRVFNILDPEWIEPSLISVMMPFDSKFDKVYKKLKETADRLDLHCRRADDIWENPAVIQDVVSLIDRSNVVICDCTGRNPNVFYEIGIAHTLGRETILITQTENDIPFDLRHLRYKVYLNNKEGLSKLSEAVQSRLESLI